MSRPYAHNAALPLLRVCIVGVFVAGLALLHLGDLSRVVGDPVGSYGLITNGTIVTASCCTARPATT